MNPLRIIAFLCLFLPAFDAPAHRLIEVNGSRVTEREIVSISVPRNGVIVIVPDRIFGDTEGAAQWHESFATGPPLLIQPNNAVSDSKTAPRGKGPRKGR